MRTGTLCLHALGMAVCAIGTWVSLPARADSLVTGPLLAPPVHAIDRLLPQSVIDSLEVPQKPVRVAARPTLQWAPGLKKSASNTEQPSPAADEAGSASAAQGAPGRVEAYATDATPILVAPRTGQPQDSSPASEPELTDPSATELLPLLVPKAKPATPSDTLEERPADKKPAKASKAERVKEPAVFVAPGASKAIKADRPEPDAKGTEPAADDRAPEASPKRSGRSESTTPSRESVTPSKQPPARPKVSEPPAPLSRSMRGLRSRLRTVLSFYYRKSLNTVEHDPWEIMHSMLSYELHSRIHNGGPDSPYMTAIGHLCFNRPSKRQRMLRVNEDGLLEAKVGVGVQGHKGQFLAMLAQCNVSPDYPIRVEGESFTIRDLIKAEQLSCESNTELTFKLIGLGHYLGSDAEWLDERGERWDFPRLIREERAQPIRGAACGGTHRLAGLSLAFRRREARGEPVDGEYAEAARFVAKYQGYAFRLQNDDGSLSTEWFRGPGDEEDIDRRLRTTGHLLEWLVYSLPDDQLRSHRTVRAVNYLTNLLASNADHEWHLGSIGHGLHALVLYDKRVFRPHDKPPEGQLAAVDPTKRLFREYPIYRGVMRNSPPESVGLFQGLFGGPRTGSAANRRR